MTPMMKMSKLLYPEQSNAMAVPSGDHAKDVGRKPGHLQGRSWIVQSFKPELDLLAAAAVYPVR